MKKQILKRVGIVIVAATFFSNLVACGTAKQEENSAVTEVEETEASKEKNENTDDIQDTTEEEAGTEEGAESETVEPVEEVAEEDNQNEKKYTIPVSVETAEFGGEDSSYGFKRRYYMEQDDRAILTGIRTSKPGEEETNYIETTFHYLTDSSGKVQVGTCMAYAFLLWNMSEAECLNQHLDYRDAIDGMYSQCFGDVPMIESIEKTIAGNYWLDDGDQPVFSYDENGNLLGMSNNYINYSGVDTSWNGRSIEIIDPEGHSFAWRINQTDIDVYEELFDLDSNGNITYCEVRYTSYIPETNEIEQEFTTIAHMTYNDEGQLIKEEEDGRWAEFSYDEAGNLTEVKEYGMENETPVLLKSGLATYDESGNILEEVYYEGEEGHDIVYNYADGLLQTVNIDGIEMITLSYDDSNRLISIVNNSPVNEYGDAEYSINYISMMSGLEKQIGKYTGIYNLGLATYKSYTFKYE